MLDLTGIKNIIFDLGGVILNIDYSLTPKAFEQLGIKGFENLYSKAEQQTLFDNFEKGFISPAGFRDGIRRKTGILANDEQLDTAWNAMLLDLPLERLQLLRHFKKTHRTFLLSNTNVIHISEINHYLSRTYQVNSLDPLFEKVYLSCEMGKRKPDAEIFLQVLKEQQLLPAETLFIDDSPQHIAGALKTGIKAFHLINSLTINKLLWQP